MSRIVVSLTIGILAGCALAGAYFGAPYTGIQLTPTLLMVVAAAVAFGSSICVIALNLLAKPGEKPTGSKLRRVSDNSANTVRKRRTDQHSPCRQAQPGSRPQPRRGAFRTQRPPARRAQRGAAVAAGDKSAPDDDAAKTA